jgi:dipeptidyl aminopeptidase/acylaminoacyl peptidase
MGDGVPVELILNGDGVDLEALWWPAPGRRAPGVVLTHPFDGDAHTVAPMGVALRNAGYHAVSISMRGFGRSGGRDDCGLRQPDDVLAVLNWMRGHDQVDGARLGLYGRSQGGLVALLTASRAGPLVRAVVVWNAVTDIDHWRRHTAHPLIPAYIETVCGADTRARSPIHVAGAIRASVLLVHGAQDERVPTAQSLMFAEAMRKAGRDAEVLLVEGRGHKFGPDGTAAALSRSLEFFQVHL